MLVVHSSAFQDGEPLPSRFAARDAGGTDTSPPLSWTGLPHGTRSLAVTCVDRAPIARDWVHWVIVDLPPDLPFLSEGASGTRMIPGQARELTGTSGFPRYDGPKPPAGSGPHPYEFTVWALDVDTLPLSGQMTAAGFEDAASGHVLAAGSITGTYER